MTVHKVAALFEGHIDNVSNNVNQIYTEPSESANNEINTNEDSDDGGPVVNLNHIPDSLFKFHAIINNFDKEDAVVPDEVK